MDKEYTILHISDLHKSEEDSYKDLMESLRMDCETYEQEGIKKPEIIVVSGDIAEGAEGPDADAKIEKHSYYRHRKSSKLQRVLFPYLTSTKKPHHIRQGFSHKK